MDNTRQYRPITLINVSYRILAKGFATRLSLVANKIIDQNQTTFICGRSTLDGIAVLHEVLHEIKTTHEDVFILNIDFEKEYDRVRWEFLEVLTVEGFDPLWISWM